ncbi:MAG: hypothetical protein ACTSVZ_02335 [Promethearchaeota archaeon]
MNLLNNIYAKAKVSAYFELIEGGVLWMIKNLEDLKRVGKIGLKMTNQVSLKKNNNSNHQNIKADLMGKFQMEDKETIFEIEPIYHSVDKIIGVIKHVFYHINPNIRVEVRNNILIMTFPNLDALVDYLEILFFVSSTQAQDSL